MQREVNRLVIDSSAWIDYFRGGDSISAKNVEAAFSQADILLPDLVFLELMRGFRTSGLAKKAAKLLLSTTRIEVAGFENVVKANQNYWVLRSLGKTVRGSIDLLIGTWCIENGVPLLHNDRDFDIMLQHLGLQAWPGNEPMPLLA
jgi:predicted nucleic acid-binding protein